MNHSLQMYTCTCQSFRSLAPRPLPRPVQRVYKHNSGISSLLVRLHRPSPFPLFGSALKYAWKACILIALFVSHLSLPCVRARALQQSRHEILLDCVVATAAVGIYRSLAHVCSLSLPHSASARVFCTAALLSLSSYRILCLAPRGRARKTESARALVGPRRRVIPLDVVVAWVRALSSGNLWPWIMYRQIATSFPGDPSAWERERTWPTQGSASASFLAHCWTSLSAGCALTSLLCARELSYTDSLKWWGKSRNRLDRWCFVIEFSFVWSFDDSIIFC